MENRFGLEEIKNAVKLFLHLDDNNVIDVVFAVYAANRLNADPLWLFVVGPPSTAKTEIISSLDGHPGIFLLSSLTPKTFISGKTSTSQTGTNFSLLPRLIGKTIIMKDFTTVLTQHRDHKSEIFSQLREIYDGRYCKAFGTGETIDWKGKIGLLAGVTPAIDAQMAVNQLLGERFLYYRMLTQNHTEAARMAIQRTSGSEAFRTHFKQTVCKFLSELDSIDPAILVDEGEFREPLINLATLCVHARSAVLRYRDQTLQSMPEPEGPARLVKQLSLLSKALAIVRGQTVVDLTIYEVVKKVSQDSLPRLRLIVLKSLWQMCCENQLAGDVNPLWFRTKDIADRSGVPISTTKLQLEDLRLLNLIVRNVESGSKNAQIWKPSQQMTEWANKSRFFITS